MTIQQLEKSWRSGKPDAVYLFHGEEEFLRSEMIEHALNIFIPDFSLRSFNYDQLSGNDHKIADLINCAKNYPVMADMRIVIMRDAEKLLQTRKGEKAGPKDESRFDGLYDYLENPNRSTLLIFDLTSTGNKAHYPWKLLFAKTTTIEFSSLKEPAAIEWIIERGAKLGKKIEPKAGHALVSHIGTDLRSLLSELEKLVAYTGERETITAKDVETTTGVSPTYNIFELQKAIGSGNKALATEIALRMLEADKSARYPMFYRLAQYLEQLSVARDMSSKRESDQAIAQAIGLYGGGAYFVKDYISAAKRYSSAKLDNAIRTLVESEFDTRRMRIDDMMLVEKLIVEIMP